MHLNNRREQRVFPVRPTPSAAKRVFFRYGVGVMGARPQQEDITHYYDDYCTGGVPCDMQISSLLRARPAPQWWIIIIICIYYCYYFFFTTRALITIIYTPRIRDIVLQSV